MVFLPSSSGKTAKFPITSCKETRKFKIFIGEKRRGKFILCKFCVCFYKEFLCKVVYQSFEKWIFIINIFSWHPFSSVLLTKLETWAESLQKILISSSTDKIPTNLNISVRHPVQLWPLECLRPAPTHPKEVTVKTLESAWETWVVL